MPVQQEEDEIDKEVAQSIDHKKVWNLRLPDRKRVFTRAKDHVAEHERKQKLQRIDIEEHDKDQHRIQQHRPGIIQRIPPEKDMLLIPDQHQQREADRKGKEPPHRDQQLVKALRNLQRNDQQRHRKRKNGVTEGLDPLHLMPPKPESMAVLPLLCREYFFPDQAPSLP